jgi:hypothetical protein
VARQVLLGPSSREPGRADVLAEALKGLLHRSIVVGLGQVVHDQPGKLPGRPKT